MPRWTERLKEVKDYQTQTADVELTRLAMVSATVAQEQILTMLAYEQTQTARPTQTMTPTISPSPTTFPTSTPIPQQNVCIGKTDNGVIREMFKLPGTGYKSPVKVPGGQIVKSLGRFEDTGWVQIEFEGEIGWIKLENFVFTEECDLTVYDLSYLLNIAKPGVKVLLEDTFASNANEWFDENEEKLYPEVRAGESLLKISAQNYEVVHTTNPAINAVDEFTLITNISWKLNSQNTYIGFRFRENDGNYFEVHLTPTCDLEVFNKSEKITSRPLVDGSCHDTASFFIQMHLDKNNRLEFSVNGYDPARVNLPDSEGNLNNGDIRLVASNTTAEIDFIIIYQNEK